MLETALFLLGGLLLVFPAVLDAAVRPLTGVTIDVFIPGLTSVGIRMGLNVPLGLIAFATGALVQRARGDALAR